MIRTTSQSPTATKAIGLIEDLQNQFVRKLEKMSESIGAQARFSRIDWLRDQGACGGGVRFEAPCGEIFDAGSVNYSHVHYESDATKSLRSATALSTIIHPNNPFAPSVHIHLSWTEYKGGNGYWRIMADLNPAIENLEQSRQFRQELTTKSKTNAVEAFAQGERYFWIPALSRHRGVVHFYLEEFNSGNFENDLRYCEEVIGGVINAYPNFLAEAISKHAQYSTEDKGRQLAYHTVYFLQVLTLDRGTTAGLMVHDQNDIGILGSLPTKIDLNLLKSWIAKHPAPQDELVQDLVNVFDADFPLIDPPVKQKIANTVRKFYQKHPKAMELQAHGTIIPKTIANHKL
jgi:coproporphyrinogen III oxidase